MKSAKLIKRVFFVFFALVSMTFLAVFALLQWPGALFNSTSLDWARSFAVKAGWEIQWKGVQTSVESSSVFRKRFRVEFNGICAENRGRGIRLCFRDLMAEAEVGFSPLLLRVVELGPVNAVGGRFTIALREIPPPSGTSLPVVKSHFVFPRWMRKARVLPLFVSIPSVEVNGREAGGELRLRGGFELFAETERDRAASVRVFGGLSKLGREGFSGGTRIELRNSRGFWTTAGWEARSSLAARIADASVNANVSFMPRVPKREKRQDIFDYDFAARGRYAGNAGIGKALIMTVGRVSREVLTARIEGTARDLVPGFERVRFTRCSLRMDASRVGLDCPTKLSLPAPPRRFAALRIPSEAKARVLVDLKTGFYPPRLSRPVEGSVRVELEPLRTPILAGAGGIRSSVSGIPSRFPEGWRFDNEIGIRVAITDFRTFAEFFRNTAWSPPAPFQVLKGSVALEARGKFDSETGSVPFLFSTQLNSAHQRFDVRGNGVFGIPGWRPGAPGQVAIDVVLDDVELALPRLDLAVPPVLAPDTRIHGTKKKEETPSEGPAFRYLIRFRTPRGQYVRILSNLAQAPVPVSFDVSLSSEKALSGRIGIQGFPAELFHRKARIERFDIELADPFSTSPIDGAAVVTYSDYTLTARLLDTFEKPRVLLTSDPPLPENQLISALLFGRPLEELDPDQAASVGSAGAAFADGALGLASLYFLASTPVQNVGYDAATGTVSASVRVAEGTSLSLGATPSEFRTVSLRKRLGPHWTITTDLEHPADSTGRTASAFLEWSRRY